jgi:diketogulonate reductase-like aldo/keto reductase
MTLENGSAAAASRSRSMRTLNLAGIGAVPLIGQGTWRMGESAARRAAETQALRTGIELGLTVIDTAEMYGDGATESFLGEALAGVREQVALVSKVYPQNAGGARLQRACEASLRRLRTDRLELYLLHWRGSTPLSETVDGMEALKRAGKIRAWGVSNLDLADMDSLAAAGGDACATDQILYNVTRRGPEFDLIPRLAARGMPVTAYSPVEQGRLPRGGALQEVGARHGATPHQVALAWAIRSATVLAIPKAGDPAHVRQNRAALDLELAAEDLAALDAEFPPPTRPARLEML